MHKFLLLGQTGVGKSSFINSALGIQVAATSDFEACTKVVKHHAYGTSLGDVCLIDTPGLAEDSLALDRKYLRMIRQNKYTKNCITLYISALNETRFRPSEKRTLHLLTEELGPSIWSRPWLLFTFAASVLPDKRNIACETRVKHISEYLYKISPTSFLKFEKIFLIDNKVTDWTNTGMPITSALTGIEPKN